MRRAIIAVAVTGLLVLGACSSDGATDGTSPISTPGADTTSASDTTAAGSSTVDASSTTVASTTPQSTVALATGAVAFTPLITGLTKPVDIATRADDATLFVVQQDGKIVPVRDGKAGAPVLDISALVSTGNEQGLLGMAFHPTDPLAYVDYTNVAGDTIVAEYEVGSDGTFDAGSARVVLTVDQPFPNHNGGKVMFGPDDMLYIGLGDGGAAGDPNRNGQNLGVMLAKILRIDPRASGGKPYTVPADNPFVDTADALAEIWSYGVRNPWRFDFDSANGDFWVADVGQNAWEEVDLVRAADGAGKGANFGWSAFEGTHVYNDDQKAPGAIAPIWEYPHATECSVSGGTVYRGKEIPSLVGWYVVADFCSGRVWALQAAADGTLAGRVPLGTLPSPSAVVDAPDGNVYVLGLADGSLNRLTPA
ncbi:MAG: hypothetical protein RJA49_802 [Actinomycetota bacterium]